MSRSTELYMYIWSPFASALIFYVEKLCSEHEIIKILNFHLQVVNLYLTRVIPLEYSVMNRSPTLKLIKKTR